MPQIYQNIYVELDESLDAVVARLEPTASGYQVLRQSIDARRKQARPRLVYTIRVFFPNEATPASAASAPSPVSWPHAPPIIVGAGPAGLFAALRLVERGIPCRLIERGATAEQRILKINRYWRYGELDLDNNVCFGEGGAGLYSDGKLITRIKSPHIPFVLTKLVQFGAPEEILYYANPHVGSDRIRRLIPHIRAYLLAKGCEIHFASEVHQLLLREQQVSGVQLRDGRKFHADQVILATGHSATDLFHRLYDQGVFMEGKSFAVGFRIEHPQSLINQLQYRQWATHPALPTASYRLADHDAKTGIGVYSFCMCPGGYVISSGTESDGLVCNGMSNYRRNSPFANAAMVISINHEERFAAKDVFAGLKFRTDLERTAFNLVQARQGGQRLPAQKVTDYLANRNSPQLLPTSSPSGVISAPLHELLPADLNQRLQKSLETFEHKMPGFCGEQAQLHGVESRTSCPIRITRDAQSLQSLSHSGLYPCGEGAGYAGGITSAAVDGVRVADALIARHEGQTA